MTTECIDDRIGCDYAEAIAKKLEVSIKSQGVEDGDKLMAERCRAFKKCAESFEANVPYSNDPSAWIKTRREQHVDFDVLNRLKADFLS